MKRVRNRILGCEALENRRLLAFDLVASTSGPLIALAGDDVTYIVTVTNNPQPATTPVTSLIATNLTLADTLPAGMTAVSHTPATIPTLASGASATFTVIAKVNSSVVNGTKLTYSGIVSSNPVDSPTTNNSTSFTTAINPQWNLGVTETAKFDPLTASLVYTINVTNAGPHDAIGVTSKETETPSTSVTFVSATTGTPPLPVTDQTYNIGALAANTTRTYTVTYKVNAGAVDVVKNTVTVSADRPDTTANSTNNTVSVETRIKSLDPGFSYVDKNNDHVFLLPDGDVALVKGEVADGQFDTREVSGGYTTVIAGAGLVVNAPVIKVPKISFKADGDVTINTALNATGKRIDKTGDSVYLASRTGDVSSLNIDSSQDIWVRAFDDIFVGKAIMTAAGEVELYTGDSINANAVSITAVGDVGLRAGRGNLSAQSSSFKATGVGSEIELIAGGNIDLNKLPPTTPSTIPAPPASMLSAGGEAELFAGDSILADAVSITAVSDVELRAGRGNISARSSTLSATGLHSEIEMSAGGTIDLSKILPTSAATKLTAIGEIELYSRGSIFAAFAEFKAGTEIEIESHANIDLTSAKLDGGKVIDLDADGELKLSEASLKATQEIDLEAHTLVQTLKTATTPGTVLDAPKIKIKKT